MISLSRRRKGTKYFSRFLAISGGWWFSIQKKNRLMSAQANVPAGSLFILMCCFVGKDKTNGKRK